MPEVVIEERGGSEGKDKTEEGTHSLGDWGETSPGHRDVEKMQESGESGTAGEAVGTGERKNNGVGRWRKFGMREGQMSAHCGGAASVLRPCKNILSIIRLVSL